MSDGQSTPARAIVVQKYGGSSVASIEGLGRVAARVVATARQGKRVCVVVSAMGKRTDELLAMAHQITPEPSRRELDMLLSCGERTSMALLSMAITRLGHEAISFTGSQSGIITNHRHSGARIIEVRPVRIEDELHAGRIVIVAGFQGVSYKREITTLGRGGSDVTAVALAGALGAEYCEICSDVDGVYTADPRVVDAATLMEHITSDAMLELAEAGAKVLHPEAVLFARRQGVVLHARATAHEPGTPGGTRIGPVETTARASGITSRRRMVRITSKPSSARELLAAVASEGLAMLASSADAERAAVLASTDDIPDWPRVARRLREGLAAEIDEDVASVSVTGDRVGEDPGELLCALRTADTAGKSIHGHDVTAHRITLYTVPDAVDDLVRALHAEFMT